MAMYQHHAGTSGTVTVPSERIVLDFSCIAGGTGATIIITPKGGSAQPTIAIPASQPFGMSFPPDPQELVAALGEGSTIAFADTSTYVVRYR